MRLEHAIGLAQILLGSHSAYRGVKRLRGSRQQSDAGEPPRALARKGSGGSGDEPKSRVRHVFSINQRVQRIVAKIQEGRTDPKVREFASKAVTRKTKSGRWAVAEHDDAGEIKAVFREIRKNVRYTADTWGADSFQRARRTLEWGSADCDDFVITLGAALQSIGFPVVCRVVQTVDSPDFNHIFLLAGIPKDNPQKWVSLDASINKPPGWHPPQNMLKAIRDFQVT